MYDDVVPGTESDVHVVEDRLFGSRVHEDLAGGDLLVQPRDGLPELRIAERLGVAEPQRVEPFARPGLQRQQVPQLHALAVRRAQ